MAVYVCSDIHGRYDRYVKLLKEIELSNSDTLYVLGDVIDRNPDGIEILLDIQKRDNVVLFLGNHELFLLDTIKGVGEETVEISDFWFDQWISTNNGGSITFEKFVNLPLDIKSSLLDMLKRCLVAKIIEVNGVKYHLSHSSTIKGFTSGELYINDLEWDKLFGLVWFSIFRYDDYSDDISKYDKDLTYIVGHVAVQRRLSDRIYRLENVIDIDCGCAYADIESSSLSCLRLDDMKEFYIS